jgi:O-antigen ligase
MRTITYALSLVFIFMLPWEGAVNFPGLGGKASNTIAGLMGLGVAAFWFATIVITGRLRKPGLIHIVFLLFVLWNVVSTFWSTNPGRAVAHARTWAQLLVMTLILWDLYTTRTAVLAGLQAYVLGAYVAFGSAAANYLSGKVFYTYYDRFSSGDTNPDGFGFILALGIPIAWHLAASTNAAQMGRLLKLVNYAYIPVAFLGISLSGTRTALIAAIPAMAFGLASLSHLRLWARIAIFILLTSAILILLPHVQTLRSFQRFSTIGTELTQGDLNNRTNNWREGLATFVEHPLKGVGSGMYRSVNSLGKVAHNSYISVLVELGLIGFVLFGSILMIAVNQAWSHPSKWDKSFWLSLLVVWAIGASTLTWEYRKTTWLFLSLIVASAALIKHRERKTDKVTQLPNPIDQTTIKQKEVLSH